MAMYSMNLYNSARNGSSPALSKAAPALAKAVAPTTSVLTSSLTISSVTDLTAKTFPFYSRIEGNLNISITTTTTKPVKLDLTKFKFLRRIEGNLIIENNTPSFNLNLAFPLLEVVTGVIHINNNTLLSSVSSKATPAIFPKLLHAASIVIQSNPLLTTFNGFPLLKSSDIYLMNSPTLVSVSGFLQLQTSKTVVIDNNSNLISLPSFSKMNNISKELIITNNNKLPTIPEFANLVSIDDITIVDNDSLGSIYGFNMLENVRDINISYNPHLLSINALAEIKIIGNLFIINNSVKNFGESLAGNRLVSSPEKVATILNLLQNFNRTGTEFFDPVNNKIVITGQNISYSLSSGLGQFFNNNKGVIYISSTKLTALSKPASDDPGELSADDALSAITGVGHIGNSTISNIGNLSNF